jgi:hypothetical protein
MLCGPGAAPRYSEQPDNEVADQDTIGESETTANRFLLAAKRQMIGKIDDVLIAHARVPAVD